MQPVLCVIGTGPEAIKMAPVVRSLRAEGVPVRLPLTGKHRELLDQALAAFDLAGDLDLAAMRPNQSLPELTARLFEGLDAMLARDLPSLVLAQGDTTTVMVAAMVAFTAIRRGSF
jgi:UDP-N-acetylglucosamine 2-epimerase (non-hydrolysing)